MIERKNNYYGIQGLINCPVNEKIKSEFSKILFLYPRLACHTIKNIGETYDKEETILTYMEYLKKDIKRFDSEYIQHRLLLTLSHWINTNGCLTMMEIYEVREYCGIKVSDFMDKLCEDLPEIKFEKKEKCITFLNYYSKYIDEKHINFVLDQILSLAS